MPELLGCHLQVMPIAQIPGVAIDVEPAERQRHLVVDHRGDFGPAISRAHLAQAVGALQAAQALALASPAALALYALA